VEDKGQVLIQRRSEKPFKGQWEMPGGFVEYDESPDIATVRETEEELGIKIKIKNIFGVYHQTDDPRGNSVIIIYLARTDDKPKPIKDVDSIMFIGKEEIPEKTIPVMRRVLEDYFKKKK